MTITTVLAVLTAGAIGSMIRYITGRAFPMKTGRFSLGVFLVNTVGSFVGGVTFGLLTHADISPELGLIIATGFCGGLTTFSTWSVESASLLRGGYVRMAVLNISVAITAGIISAGLGFMLAQLLR